MAWTVGSEKAVYPYMAMTPTTRSPTINGYPTKPTMPLAAAHWRSARASSPRALVAIVLRAQKDDEMTLLAR